MKANVILLVIITAAMGIVGNASAQPPDQRGPHTGFFEATGAYGLQFGETEYLPDNAGDEFKHPIVNGFAVGATAGLQIVPDLQLIGNYEFTSAHTRDGEINHVVDEIEGSISYHTAVVGARLSHQAGIGDFFGELGVGLLFPLETELQFTYAPEMSQLPTPVVGTGTKIDEYNVGYGAQALFGYRVPLSPRVYLATALKLKSFQTQNENKQTQFDNFITDFTTMEPVTASIEHDNEGPGQPTTYSVQDIRLQLAVGATF